MKSKTAMQLTPIQFLIEQAKTARDNPNLGNDITYDMLISVLKSMLPKEQEAIEQAYNEADKTKWSAAPKVTATEYYTNTYGQTNT